jgi:transcriptional regulator GlxA family with amidase domain
MTSPIAAPASPKVPPRKVAAVQTRATGRPAPQPLRIGIVLARRFTLSALANFIDVLRLSADEADRSRQILCQWEVIGALQEPVHSSCGIPVPATHRPSDPRDYDYIAVVGGLIEPMGRLPPEVEKFLLRASAERVPLVGICTGAFILARLGLMQGYKCCVSWFHHGDFIEEFDTLQPVADQIFVVDRDRLTCSGGVSAAHLAAFLVERHISRSVARKSLSIMIIDQAEAGERPQPGLPLELSSNDPVVKRALLWMQQTIDAPLSVARLAERLGIGRRKLERHFADTLGITPAEAGRRVRLAQARTLVERGEKTVTEIAHATGFCDASHLIRHFRELYGLPPEAWRQAQDLSPV